MMADDSRPRLGRGLAALIGDAREESVAPQARSHRRLPIEFLQANRRNPRKAFAEEALADLVNSIREKGVLQPILVRAMAGVPDRYEIIAGERRWRAAQRASLHEIPVVILEASDKEALEFAIIENVQRADLNAIEEAAGYQQLMQDFDYTQADLAKTIGKSRSHVANTMRLLNVSETVKAMVLDGTLSAGHARALLSARDPDVLARRIVKEHLSVRDAEQLVQAEAEAPGAARTRPRGAPDANIAALERSLTDALGLAVSLSAQGERGELRIRYQSLEQLDALCARLRP